MQISFYLCNENGIGDIQVIARDKNNSMAVIFNGSIAENSCEPVSSNASGAGYGEIEIRVNGGTPYGKPYINSDERINVY